MLIFRWQFFFLLVGTSIIDKHSILFTDPFHPCRSPILFRYPRSSEAWRWTVYGFIQLASHPPCCISWFSMLYPCTTHITLSCLRCNIWWQAVVRRWNDYWGHMSDPCVVWQETETEWTVRSLTCTSRKYTSASQVSCAYPGTSIKRFRPLHELRSNSVKQDGAVFKLNDTQLNLINQYTYLAQNISSI